MSHKKATGVAGLAALALVLTACTGTQSPGGGSNGAAGKQRIVVSLDSEISVLEPQTFRTLGAFAATAGLYCAPLKEQFVADGGMQKATGQTKPGLAQSVEAAPDGKTVTITLRDAKFADGSPVTSEDVVYTIQRAIDGPGYVKALTPFLGLTDSSQVSAKDPKTVELAVTRVSPLLKKFLTFQVFGAIQKKVAEAHKTADDPWAAQWFTTHSTSCGPYTLENYSSDMQQIDFKPNPNYYDAAALPNAGIVMRYVNDPDQRALLLEKGQIDVASGLSPQLMKKLEGDEGVKVYHAPSSRLVYLGMDNKTAPFNNPKVRQAIASAVPYDDLINSVMQGYAHPAGNVVTASMETYAGDKAGNYTFDLAAAKASLAASGVKTPISVDLTIRQSRPQDQQSAVYIQDKLGQIGIKVNINRLPDAQFSERLNKKQLSFFIHDWYSWGEDPFYQMNFLVKSSAPTNFSQYANPELDKLIDTGMWQQDEGQRAATSKQAQDILLRDTPVVPLYSPDWAVAARSNVTGVTRSFTEIVQFDQLGKSK
jgi:peptide/nickel transport system substrate-binding protein